MFNELPKFGKVQNFVRGDFMNNKRTKLIVRIVAIVIAVLMVASVVLSAVSIR